MRHKSNEPSSSACKQPELLSIGLKHLQPHPHAPQYRSEQAHAHNFTMIHSQYPANVTAGTMVPAFATQLPAQASMAAREETAVQTAPAHQPLTEAIPTDLLCHTPFSPSWEGTKSKNRHPVRGDRLMEASRPKTAYLRTSRALLQLPAIDCCCNGLKLVLQKELQQLQ